MALPLGWAAVAVALAVLAGSWIWDNFVLVGRRLVATRDIPEPAGGHWLLGHIPQLLSRYGPLSSFRCFEEWARTLGPLYRVRFFWRPVLVVTDPELYQPLLRHGPSKLQKHTPPYRMFEIFVRPPRGNMLSSTETPIWRTTRRAAVAALTLNNLRLCFPHITAVTTRLLDAIAAAGPGAELDMDAAAQAVTVDVIGLAAFDRDLRATSSVAAVQGMHALEIEQQQQQQVQRQQPRPQGISPEGRGPEVMLIMRHLLISMQKRNNPLNRWFPWRQAYRDLMYWGGCMSSLVQDLYADLLARPPPSHTLAAHLMAARRSDTGELLDPVQVMAELGLLWGAGFETTAHTIAWTLALVSTHPDIEARLCSELKSLGLLAEPGGPPPTQLDWEHLAQLRYLSAVVNESMRLFPVVSSGTIRVTHAPATRLGPCVLPPGQPILIPFFSVHRSPALWKDPDAFKPERWLPAAAGGSGGGSSDHSRSRGSKDSAVPGDASSGEEDYVDVGADCQSDLAEARDQGAKVALSAAAQSQRKLPVQRDAAGSMSGLELKDSATSRRGFLPFSEGARNCVGQVLALLEVKAVLAVLLGSYSFSLHPSMGGYEGISRAARQAITLRPEGGLIMTARHRASTC